MTSRADRSNPSLARLPRPASNQAAADSGIAISLSMPAAVLEVLRELIREECSAALDAQSKPSALLTDERVCSELLDCSTKTLRNKLIPSGLPHIMVGDARRYEPAAVLEWLRAQRANGGSR